MSLRANGNSSSHRGIELSTFGAPAKPRLDYKGTTQTTATPSGDNDGDVPAYAEANSLHTRDGDVRSNVDGLQRHLTNRQIQMIAIGGSIGTALFVSIGYGLIEGGPANLLLGFTIYSCFLALVNSCVAEMTVYMPVSGGFVRLSGKVSF